MPEVPEVDASLPEVSGDAVLPDVSGSVPDVSAEVSVPDVSADASAPDVSGSLPGVSGDVSVPDVSASVEGAVSSVDISGKTTRRNGRPRTRFQNNQSLPCLAFECCYTAKSIIPSTNDGYYRLFRDGCIAFSLCALEARTCQTSLKTSSECGFRNSSVNSVLSSQLGGLETDMLVPGLPPPPLEKCAQRCVSTRTPSAVYVRVLVVLSVVRRFGPLSLKILLTQNFSHRPGYLLYCLHLVHVVDQCRPDVAVDADAPVVPSVAGDAPSVSGDVSIPSVGGEVSGALPSVDVAVPSVGTAGESRCGAPERSSERTPTNERP